MRLTLLAATAVLTLAAGAFAQAPIYSAAVVANTAGNSVGLVSADFNGDSIPDVATANFSPDTVTIGLATAPGVIGPLNSVAADSAIDLAAGAIDANGSLDLVVVNFDTKTFTVLFNNGAGIFSSGLPIAVGNDPTAVAIADLDGDGANDVVIVDTADNDIRVYTNDGLGNFGAFTLIPTGFIPSAVEVADLDGNALADMAVTNAGSNTVSILLADGLGGFTAAAAPLVGVFPISIASGDIDHDHDIDLIVANQAGDSVTTLRNAGNGTFPITSTFLVGNGPIDLVVADIDHRNGPDFAVVHFSAGNVRVYTNAGNGNFNLQQTMVAGAFPANIAAADFDGDDNVDLVGANNVSPDLVLFWHLGSDNLYPGTGDDLALGMAVGAAPSFGPGSRLVEGTATQFVSVAIASPNGSLDFFPYLLAAQAFESGFPLPNFLAGVWLEPNAPGLLVLVNGYQAIGGFSSVITPGGSTHSFVIPAGLEGYDIMFQALTLTASANNGILAATDGATLRLK